MSHSSTTCSLSLFRRSFGTVSHSSPTWSLSKSKEESDSSSTEETGQAYVVGKDLHLCCCCFSSHLKCTFVFVSIQSQLLRRLLDS